MSEPSYHPSSQGPMPTSMIALHDVRTGLPHEGQLGKGVLLQTDRGTIHAILHPSPEARYGVIWVCGARGGFGGPGQGTYVRLAEALRQEGIVSLRLNYRYPNVLPECALDILAGVAYLQQDRARPVAHPVRYTAAHDGQDLRRPAARGCARQRLQRSHFL